MTPQKAAKHRHRMNVFTDRFQKIIDRIENESASRLKDFIRSLKNANRLNKVTAEF